MEPQESAEMSPDPLLSDCVLGSSQCCFSIGFVFLV